MTFWHTKSLEEHGFLDELTGSEGSAAKTLSGLTGNDGRYATSQRRLAERAGVSRETLRSALQKLETLGLISREQSGRRSATVYRWHSCPADCVDVKHTGKRDSRASRFLFGEVVETAPVVVDVKPVKKKGKAARRREAQEAVKFRPVEDVKKDAPEWSSEWPNSNPSGLVSGLKSTPSGLVARPLKDKPGLKTEKSTTTETVTPSGLVDYLDIYAAVYQSLEKLADSGEVDALEAEVLLTLLDTSDFSGKVTGLAAELFTAEQLAALSFGDAEQLRQQFEHTTQLDTRELFTAIYYYNRQPGQRWRDLTMVNKKEWALRCLYAAELSHVSVVAPNVSSTVSNIFPSSFPPHEKQVESLLDGLARVEAGQAAAGPSVSVSSLADTRASVTTGNGGGGGPVVALDDYRQRRNAG